MEAAPVDKAAWLDKLHALRSDERLEERGLHAFYVPLGRSESKGKARPNTAPSSTRAASAINNNSHDADLSSIASTYASLTAARKEDRAAQLRGLTEIRRSFLALYHGFLALQSGTSSNMRAVQEAAASLHTRMAAFKTECRHDYTRLMDAYASGQVEEGLIEEIEEEMGVGDQGEASSRPAASPMHDGRGEERSGEERRGEGTSSGQSGVKSTYRMPLVHETYDSGTLASMVSEVDAVVAARGGERGGERGWPAAENDIFTAAITAYRSTVGKLLPRPAGDDGLVKVVPLTEDEASTFVAAVLPSLLLSTPDAILEHTRWYEWAEQARLDRKYVLTRWRKAVTEEKKVERTKAIEQEAAAAPKPPPPPRPTSPSTRAAVAEWRAAKQAEKEEAEARASAARRAAAAEADARRFEWARKQADTLEKWRSERVEQDSKDASVLHGGHGGPKRRRGGADDDDDGYSSGSNVWAPTAAELNARAEAALQAAKAKKALLDERSKAQTDAIARRHGLNVHEERAAASPRTPSHFLSAGTRERYSYVPNDPEAVTTAAARRHTSQSELAARMSEKKAAGAHSGPVPSQTTAKGRSYTFGGVGVLASRATPAWMKPG